MPLSVYGALADAKAWYSSPGYQAAYRPPLTLSVWPVM